MAQNITIGPEHSLLEIFNAVPLKTSLGNLIALMTNSYNELAILYQQYENAYCYCLVVKDELSDRLAFFTIRCQDYGFI